MPAGKRDGRDSQYEAPGRLAGRRTVGELFREGKRLHGKNLTLIYRSNPDGISRCAVFTPKKLGGAVRRNRTRRVLRETVRRQPHPALRGKDTIILCKRPLDEDFAASASIELIELLDRLAGN